MSSSALALEVSADRSRRGRRKQDRRKTRSLKIIEAVCQAEFDRPLPDFSYRWIGQCSADRGGICAGTIENSTGADYQDMIAGYAKRHPSYRAVALVSCEPAAFRFTSVQSPSEREQIRELIAERNKLAAMVEGLRARLGDQTIHLAEQGSGEPLLEVFDRPTLDLLPTEWAALSAAFSPTALRRHAWTADAHGRITDADAHEVLPIGFLPALEKILTLKP